MQLDVCLFGVVFIISVMGIPEDDSVPEVSRCVDSASAAGVFLTQEELSSMRSQANDPNVRTEKIMDFFSAILWCRSN